MPRPKEPESPFRYFNSSPEVMLQASPQRQPFGGQLDGASSNVGSWDFSAMIERGPVPG